MSQTFERVSQIASTVSVDFENALCSHEVTADLYSEYLKETAVINQKYWAILQKMPVEIKEEIGQEMRKEPALENWIVFDNIKLVS
jgi:hypothetical protein